MIKAKAWLSLLALVAMLLSAGTVVAQTPGSGGRSLFDWVIAKRVLVTGSNGLTVWYDATVGDSLTLSEQTGITLTTGSTLAPTGSSQPIRSAGTINFGAISGCAAANAGELLVVVNDTATTINITDSATLRLTGNLALGQFDTVLLYCDGLTWIQLSTANN